MKNFSYALIFLSLLMLSSCSTSEPSYSASSVGQVSQVKQGKIIDIQQVHIKGSSNIGAQIGGLGGAFGGAGTGMLTSIAGSIGGAIVGGIAGGATEDAITSSKGYQFTIQLNNGDTLAILQEDKHGLNIGDQITIYMSGNNTRIVPAKN